MSDVPQCSWRRAQVKRSQGNTTDYGRQCMWGEGHVGPHEVPRRAKQSNNGVWVNPQTGRTITQERVKTTSVRYQKVYYVQEPSTTQIKIGTTVQDAPQRVRGLQTGTPRTLELLATEPGGKAQEKARHKQFAHLRSRGEWFWPAEELMLHIKLLKETGGDPNLLEPQGAETVHEQR